MSALLDAPEVRVEALHPVLGVRITGLDLSCPSAVRLVRDSLARHLLVIIPDQQMDPVAQIALTARLGGVTRHPLDGLVLKEAPDALLEIPSQDLRDAEWHAHLTWAATPNRFSALIATRGGGAADFASLIHAYDRLSPWLRDRVEYLQVAHDHARRRAAGLAEAVHPLVRVDPDSGRRSLLLDAGTAQQVIGLPQAEGDVLLHRLLTLATEPSVTLRHRWQAGDLVLWDNRVVLHRVVSAPDGALRRTMVRGTTPLGPAAFATPWVSAG
ncbi:TauD/TfdA dioxygenase family protein [Falsiroseomonas sp. HC035]|uniref:TauD/TfdA dioxygenase family protein n=1 Tax=Falsiroseomonas sp. HC035 TaxID=3390999 RepID=UPI003D3229E3